MRALLPAVEGLKQTKQSNWKRSWPILAPSPSHIHPQRHSHYTNTTCLLLLTISPSHAAHKVQLKTANQLAHQQAPMIKHYFLGSLLIVASLASDGSDEPFIGWKGDTYKPHEVFPQEAPGSDGRSWIELISWQPRAFYYHNFLTAEQADTLTALAKPRMQRSTVVGDKEHGVVAEIRTSYGAFLRRHSHPVIDILQRKLAHWTHLNTSHQEDIQILRYGPGQKYGAHMDLLENGSPRVCTVLVYLRDTEEGGETAFPHDSEWLDPKTMPGRFGPFSECAQGHVAVKPKKGDALLFYSSNPDGSRDEHSLHSGCPVIKGTKWTATIWIHSQPFRPENLEGPQTDEDAGIDPGECKNHHDMCESWAKMGECKNNPGYMTGEGGAVGHCRLACQTCEVCAPGDAACSGRNRLAAGFLPLDTIDE